MFNFAHCFYCFPSTCWTFLFELFVFFWLYFFPLIALNYFQFRPELKHRLILWLCATPAPATRSTPPSSRAPPFNASACWAEFHGCISLVRHAINNLVDKLVWVYLVGVCEGVCVCEKFCQQPEIGKNMFRASTNRNSESQSRQICRKLNLFY